MQECDLSIDQLLYRRRELPERGELARMEARARELETRRSRLDTDREDRARRQSQIDSQVATFASRIEAIESRLRQGGDYRDVQAMSTEMDSLTRHRRALEDEELEIMEQVEVLDAELESLAGEASELLKDRETVSARIKELESELDAGVEASRNERSALALGLPADLLSSYERIRARLGGIGAARLVEGTCSGYHLKLPSSERERALNATPGEIVYCDQCGRILVT